MSDGYSGTPLPKKLGIVDDVVFTVRHPPAGFADTLGDIGDAIKGAVGDIPGVGSVVENLAGGSSIGDAIKDALGDG